MKLFTLLTPALLAGTTLALNNSTSSTTSTAQSPPTSSAAAPDHEPQSSPEEPTPVGAIWTPKWSASDLAPYTKRCASSTKLTATIYKLGEIYPTLEEFAAQLKVFYHKQHYPGSWNGEDKHGNDRELLKMDYEELPYGVREYLKEDMTQRHFNIQEGSVFFAPGAIYPILPLFVEEPDEAVCEGVFGDLDSYSTEAKEDAVLGKVEYKKGAKQEVQITVSAFQVTKAKAGGQNKDEL